MKSRRAQIGGHGRPVLCSQAHAPIPTTAEAAAHSNGTKGIGSPDDAPQRVLTRVHLAKCLARSGCRSGAPCLWGSLFGARTYVYPQVPVPPPPAKRQSTERGGDRQEQREEQELRVMPFSADDHTVLLTAIRE